MKRRATFTPPATTRREQARTARTPEPTTKPTPKKGRHAK